MTERRPVTEETCDVVARRTFFITLAACVAFAAAVFAFVL